MKTQRPPIVTVLGHVDHGKTTLLDAIRKTSVAAREVGGITQGIGASQIVTSEGRITFVDTPGHAAFSKMRARGAKVADIAILVVAADDGIMPQTKEALGYILEQQIPFIVAFTKVDLPSANLDKVRGQLMEAEVFFEGMGGQTPSVEVSAPQQKGIDELIEIIQLISGVNDISGDPEAPLSGSVIETNKDKRGVIVSFVIKNGTVKVGDEIVAGRYSARVKGLFDENNKPIKKASIGDPVAVLGFTDVPDVGAEVCLKSDSKVQLSEASTSRVHPKVGDEQLGVVLKAQTAGALEAISAMLPPDAVIVGSSVGDVTESDIFFAKASSAVILSFEAKSSGAVSRLAETEDVEIVNFKIIYELSEYVDKRIKELKSTILGKAEVLAEFPFDRTRVAGCKIIEGRIKKGDSVLITRAEKQVGESRVVSLRRGKNDIPEAKVGEDCGIILSGMAIFEKGDILVATRQATVKK